MSNPLEVLLLDDEAIVGKRLKPAIEKINCNVEVFQDPKLAVERINEKEFDIVVTDIYMDDMDGMQVLDIVLKKSSRTKVIMITGYAMISLARDAMEKGAFDFIAKPFNPNDLRVVIAKAAKALGSSIDLNALLKKQELIYMRRAARIVEAMHARIFNKIEPGMRKSDLVAEIYDAGIRGADGVKTEQLGVSATLLADFGAVSQETVLAMAAGCRQRIGADYSVAVSGISGPDGGLPDKPVGTTWVAVATPVIAYARRYRFPADRERNRLLTVAAAVDSLRRVLEFGDEQSPWLPSDSWCRPS